LQPADYASLYAVASDPLIWEQHPDRHRYQQPVFDAFFQQALESRGALVAMDRATGRVIGSSRYHGYDPTAREVEIGWSFLARACWGSRYNGDMKRLMIDHAFRWVDRVLFIIGTTNLRSQRAIEKIGAVPIGERRDASGRESLLFALTPEQYAPHRARLLSWLGPTGSGTCRD
jgi:RimJ/RimL family protein N-acetyltransferase